MMLHEYQATLRVVDRPAIRTTRVLLGKRDAELAKAKAYHKFFAGSGFSCGAQITVRYNGMVEVERPGSCM